MSRNGTKVSASRLRRETDPDTLAFGTTDDLGDLGGLFDQNRVMDGLRISLHSSEKAFNLRAITDGVTGRDSAFMNAIRDIINSRPDVFKVYDQCLAHNPSNPERPFVILVPRGQGEEFACDMESLRDSLEREILQKVREKSEVSSAEIWGEFDGELEEFGASFDEVLASVGLTYRIRFERVTWSDPNGSLSVFVLPRVPIGDDGAIEDPFVGFIQHSQTMELAHSLDENFRVVIPPAFNNWLDAIRFSSDPTEDKGIKVAISYKIKRLEFRGNAILSKAYSELSEEISDGNADTMASLFDELARDLYEKYKIADNYLASLRNLVRNRYGMFNLQDGQVEVLPGTNINALEAFKVHVLVDNGNLKDAAPIVFEDDPTFPHVAGRVVSQIFQNQQGQGFSVGGSMNLKNFEPGSLLRANGGVLVIPMENLVMQRDFQDTWRFLINAIANEEVIIEDFADRLGFFQTSKFKPEPIPVKVRVILLTNHDLDNLFASHFQRDYRLFRRKADFVSTTKRNKKSECALARFLGTSSRKSGILHCNREGAAAIANYASWLAEDSGKLSLDFGSIKDLLLQADYWAHERDPKAEEITREDVEQALSRQIFRTDRVREMIQEWRRNGTFKMAGDTEGREGRINALTVYTVGEFEFGSPTVVSAVTAPAAAGRYAIVDIDRMAGMSGKILQKGVGIVSGFFINRYGQDNPLALYAQIVFEQSYNEVDGDSASIAEFLALISSLVGIPIKPNIAVTGSCSQHGDVQAIGGCHIKIEGFYDVWNILDIKKKSKENPVVIIPKDNVRELMLRPDVVQAVRDGKLEVHAVSTIDEAVEIAMGVSAKDIDTQVRKKLSEMASKAKESSSDEPSENGNSR